MNPNTKKLVEESGMIPHLKATNILRPKDWSVLVSPYYYDSISDSIRETDLIAEKQFNTGYGDGSSVLLNIQLFIECKYIKQEVVFWFDHIDKRRAIVALEKETGLDIVEAGYKHVGDIAATEFRYFSEDSVAKLFSANLNKEDVIYKAMNQSLHAQLNRSKQGKHPINLPFNTRQGATTHIVQYPVIVCENFSNLMRVEFEDNNSYTVQALKDYFILETNYRDDYFLIDIVDVDYLDAFLNKLEKETSKLVQAYSSKI